MLRASLVLRSSSKKPMSSIPAPPFASSRTGFLQTPFQLGNQYDDDPITSAFVKRYCPEAAYSDVSKDLRRLSDVSLTEYVAYANDAEANPPRLEQFDAFGHRIDRLVTPEGWRKLHDVSAVEGLVATAYERKYGAFSRVYQVAKLMIWTPQTATYGCPLAMTDGAARLIELSGNEDLKRNVYPHLVSRDPKSFWTSGQWMTERPGGSDVGRSETQAVRQADGSWSVSGFKWFSSATDSDITLLLARGQDAQGNVVESSRGLSLFFGYVRQEDGKLNGIRIQRLKNKFGTKALPTAELELDNMKAILVGAEGRGIPTVSTILNITRIWAGITCSAAMRRAVNIARDYATRREAFGSLLCNQPLHLATLANMELETRAAQLFSYDVALLLGKIETNTGTKDDEALLRLLTPIVKLYVSKQSIVIVSEGMEALGGQGYIEDTGLARILRDTFVNSIWEGTTNILSLDVLRVFSSSKQSLDLMAQRILALQANAGSVNIDSKPIKAAVQTISQYIEGASNHGKDTVEAGARQLAFALARTYCAALLVDHAVFTKAGDDIVAAERWVANLGKNLGLSVQDESSRQKDKLLLWGAKANL